MLENGGGSQEIIWILTIAGSAVPWLGLLNRLTGDKDRVRGRVERHQETLLERRASATVDLFQRGEKLLIYSGDSHTGGDEPPTFAIEHWRDIESVRNTERILRTRRAWYDRLHSGLVGLIIIGVLNLIVFAFIAVISGIAAIPSALAIIGLGIAASAVGIIGVLYVLSTGVEKIGDNPLLRGRSLRRRGSSADGS